MPLGDLISGAFSFFGGRSAAKAQSRSNAENFAHLDKWNARSESFAREQFEKGIQTRVADARKAGIHPLYALGMPGAGSPSFSAGGGAASSALGEGISRAGAAVGRAFKKPDPLARELHDAQVANLRAQTAKSHAEALYFDSEARRGQNGVGLGFQGERGQRAANIATEAALIRRAISSRRGGKRNGPAKASAAAGSRGSKRARRNSIASDVRQNRVVMTRSGPMMIPANTPRIDEHEPYMGEWADWFVGLPNIADVYLREQGRRLMDLYGPNKMRGPASERQRTLRWLRRRKNPR